MAFNPSKYQSEVFTFIENETGNAVIEAKAGSGKTTTLVQALEKIPATKSVLFLAFNKSIATELQERAPKHVRACTLNSYGASLLHQNIKGYIKLDADKSMTLLRFNILNVKKGDKEAESYYYTIRHAVKRVVSLLKANYICKPTHNDVIKMMENYDITVKLDEDKMPMFYDNCIATFTLGINNFKTVDFDDQIFMPVYHKWNTGNWDFVFVDEAQDLNPVQIELIKRMI